MKLFQVSAIVAGLAYAAFMMVFCVFDPLHAGLPTEMGGLMLRLDPKTMALNQVWLLIARSAIALKLADPIATIKALNALCAGASLCGLLLVFRRLLACGMSRVEVSALFFRGDDNPNNSAPQTENSHAVMSLLNGAFSRRERVALTLGILGAGLVYAFSAPLWITANRAGPQAFDTLLLLVVIWLSTSFFLWPSLRGACLVGAVAGMGIVEIPVFIVAMIVLLIFYFRTVINFELPLQRYFVAAMVSVGVGFTVQLVLVSLLLRESLGSAIPVTQAVRLMAASHLDALQDFGFSPQRMCTLFWVSMPFVLVLCHSLHKEMETRWDTIALLIVATGSLGLTLLNCPYASGSDWRECGGGSLIVALVIVFATGYFISRWCLVATVAHPRREEADNDKRVALGIVGWRILRVVGVGGLVLTLALAVGQPILNWELTGPIRMHGDTVTDGIGADTSGGGLDQSDAFVIDPEADAVALARSAMDLLDQGRVDEVEQIVLPWMARMKPALDRDRMDLLHARTLLARGNNNLDSARILLLHILPRHLPEQDRIGEWMLEVGLGKQDWSMVERDCQTILKVNPLHVRANELLGRALLKRGATQKAIIHLSKTLTFVTNAPILTAMGEAYLRTDQADLARETLEAAIRQPDVSGDAYLLLAQVLVKQGQPDAVIELVRDTPTAFHSPEMDLVLAVQLQSSGQALACRRILDLAHTRRDQMNVRQIRQLDELLRQTADAN
jgi:tetratricopeptide (TPR) repeat protein